MRQGENYKTELEAHLIRCLTDRRYYFASHLHVISEQSKLVSFGELFPTQAKIQDIIDKNVADRRPTRLIILKSRRHRISTLMAANIFHTCTMEENRRGYIVAHDVDTTDTLFRMHKVFYENLDHVVQPMIRLSNKKELMFENPDSAERKSNPGLRSSITVRSASSGGKRTGANQGAAGVGRGDRIDLLHGSEVAFWANGEETFTGFAQAVPDEPGTLVAMESTANGMAGFFYEEWLRATSGDEDAYTPVFIPWYEHPNYVASFVGRNRPEWAPSEFEEKTHAEFLAASAAGVDSAAERAINRLGLTEEEQMLSRQYRVGWDNLKWRRWCIKFKCRGKAEVFHVEYPSFPEEAFASSGIPRFNNEKIRSWFLPRCRETVSGTLESLDQKEWDSTEGAWAAPELIFRNNRLGWLNIVDPPQKKHRYVIGSDAGHGIGRDASTMAVFDRTERRFVAYMRDNSVKPDKLAEYLIKAGHYYNAAHVAPEFNGPGVLTSHLLVKAGYPRLYYTQRYNTATQKWTDQPGFLTDQRTRERIIGMFDVALENLAIEIPIRAILDEALTFVLDERKGRADHLPGCHDDLLFACMIALFVDEQAPHVPHQDNKAHQISWSLRPPVAPDDLKKEGELTQDELSLLFH